MVRQYRFLLRQAPPDAVEAAHAEALAQLPVGQRRLILAAVQQGLLAGQRLGPADTAQVARVLVLGERRSPNAFLSSCPSDVLLTLAQTVLDSEACFGLFAGYAAWDGADPQSEDDSAWADAGFDPDSGRWNTARTVKKDGDIAFGGFPDGTPRRWWWRRQLLNGSVPWARLRRDRTNGGPALTVRPIRDGVYGCHSRGR